MKVKGEGPHIDVLADQYMADKDMYDEMEDMGFDVDPVDAYGAYVPLDSNNKDNLDEVEENIHRRFNLKQSPVGKDPYTGDKRK